VRCPGDRWGTNQALDEAQPTLERTAMGSDWFREDRIVPLRRSGDETEESPQRRRLARPRSAQQTYDLAAAHSEGQAVCDPQWGTERFGQVVNLDDPGHPSRKPTMVLLAPKSGMRRFLSERRATTLLATRAAIKERPLDAGRGQSDSPGSFPTAIADRRRGLNLAAGAVACLVAVSGAAAFGARQRPAGPDVPESSQVLGRFVRIGSPPLMSGVPRRLVAVPDRR